MTYCPTTKPPSFDILIKGRLRHDFASISSSSSITKNLGDMANRIEAMSSSNEINNWILEADKILRESSASNPNDDQRSCCFSGKACSRCKLQKKIKKLIVRGNTIIKRANLLPKRVEQIREVPSIKDDTTAARNLNRVMDILEDDDVRRIGIWGPGGVGKTTLVKALNNRLNSTSSFNLVIFVSMTKDVDVKGMQKDIAQRLSIKVEGMDTGYVAEQIHNRLQREKFLLIVDNVWEFVDLPSIGVPKNKADSKVVLTTRRLELCRIMEAEPFEIRYLTDEEAWQLFVEKAGNVVEREEIKALAKDICRECGRLPLALVVVGSAMKGKVDSDSWHSARDDLRRSIPISGVESGVYNALKFSHDWLESDTLRSCFLYCSLYPEGEVIGARELVDCWLAEKVIDEQLYYENALHKGLDSIKKLVDSCLLEKFDGGTKSVRMHDVVRDFARWIAGSHGRSMIFSGHGVSRVAEVTLPEEVKNVEWISFVDNKQIKLPQHRQDFPKVTSILLHGTRKNKVEVPHEFLKGFKSLAVLNMQGIESFPGSSLSLPKLHALILTHCDNVEEIPCVPKLMILDLIYCKIDNIWRGVRQLTHLKVLRLRYINHLESVDVEVISNLKFLEVLDMRGSGYEWPTKRKRKSNYSSEEAKATLQDLSGLEKLMSVHIDLADMECSYEDCYWMERLEYFTLSYLRGFNNVGGFFQERRIIEISGVECAGNEDGSFIFHAESLSLYGVQNVDKLFVNSNLIDRPNSSKLKELIIIDFSFSTEHLTGPATNSNSLILSNLERLCLGKVGWSFSQIASALGTTTFPKLRWLYVDGISKVGSKMKNLLSSNDPHMELPELEEITLQECRQTTEVFHCGPTKTQAVVPKLKRLNLYNLRSLQRLYNCESSNQLQSLEVPEVWGCPNLKKLPHMTSIKEIRGREEWWNELEWDSQDTKSRMTQFFKP